MADLGTFDDAGTITLERTFPGPLARVWEWITVPEKLATWLAPGDFELRPGGRVELRFDVEEVAERAEAGALIRGTITQLEPMHRLAYTWTDPATSSEVAFELSERGTNVVLVVSHRGLPRELAARCGAGWHAHLERLSAALAGKHAHSFATLFADLVPKYEAVLAPRRALTVVTVGVTDLARSRRFYEEGLGFRASSASVDDVVFFDAGGVVLALYPRALLAADAKIGAEGSGFGGITLAHNAPSRHDVDRLLEAAKKAGGKILKPAEETFWGGYSGYFADPDGYPWEVAHNPGWPLDEAGRVVLPK